MQQTIKLMADYQCWPLWWAGEHEPGNIDPSTLSLRPETVAQLEQWAEAFDATLNWDDPAGAAAVSAPSSDALDQEGRQLWNQLRAELEPHFTVLYYSPKHSRVFAHPSELDVLETGHSL